MSLQQGLIGHWTMDEQDRSGGVVYDKSAYDVHMSVNDPSSISTASANVGNGTYFADSGSAITNADSIPDDFGNKIKDSCAISFWAKNLSFSGDNAFSAWVIRSSGQNIDKSIGVFGGRSNESFTFERRDESGSFQGIGTSTSTWGSNWHHIVCQFSSSDNNLEMWVDGELDNTQSNNFQATSDFTGLAISFGGLDGQLDDVRLYSRTLTESEINQLYQMRSNRTVSNDLSKGLVVHWTMDGKDISGGTIYDKSGYSNNIQTDSSVTTGESGITGESIYTDATGGTAQTDTIEIDEHTVSFWIKPYNQSSSSYEQFIENGTGNLPGDGLGGRKPLVSRLPDNDEWHWRVSTGGNDNDGTNTTGGIDVGEWSHWAGVHTDGNLTVYKNGEVSDDVSVDPGFGSGYGPVRLQFNTIECNMDDIRIYNRGLSESEVIRLYNKRT